MRFSVDVVFLNQTNKIIKVVPHLKPWEIVSPVDAAISTLELPIGTIDTKNNLKRDTIALYKKKTICAIAARNGLNR